MIALDDHRDHIFAVAYRMLGTVTDAEDVVQDTWVRWLRRESRDDVRSPRAFLTTTAARLSLDRLRRAQRERERYDGMWLPEPIVDVSADPEARAASAWSLSPAFLVVLETLAPIERAAFLLRDVFELDYPAIADVIDKSDANCRQICKRARDRVAGAPRFEADPQTANELAARFFVAAQTGDVDGLIDVLREDIVAWSDHGGKASAARQSIRGASHVARYMVGAANKFASDKHPVFVSVSGHPGVVLFDGDAIHAVLYVIADGDKIARVGTIRNPEKLSHLKSLRPLAAPPSD